MRNITFIILLIILFLNSCSNKKEKNIIPKSKKIEDSYSQADSELEFEKEKIALLSVIRGIPKDSIYLVLRDYYAKNDLLSNFENDYTEEFIDTISKNRKMSKQKVASIIFSFKYEMQTKEEIEQEAKDSYEEFKNDNIENEEQY
ncbi:hypothetical protein [Flavobacterium microcysteis]